MLKIGVIEPILAQNHLNSSIGIHFEVRFIIWLWKATNSKNRHCLDEFLDTDTNLRTVLTYRFKTLRIDFHQERSHFGQPNSEYYERIW